jgi:hypothetical protein
MSDRCDLADSARHQLVGCSGLVGGHGLVGTGLVGTGLVGGHGLVSTGNLVGGHGLVSTGSLADGSYGSGGRGLGGRIKFGGVAIRHARELLTGGPAPAGISGR